jgi:hypothetical protein
LRTFQETSPTILRLPQGAHPLYQKFVTVNDCSIDASIDASLVLNNQRWQDFLHIDQRQDSPIHRRKHPVAHGVLIDGFLPQTSSLVDI